MLIVITQMAFDFFGQFRSRFEYRNNRDFTEDITDMIWFVNMRTRLGFKVNINENLMLKVVFQDSRLYGSGGFSSGALEGISYTATNSLDIENLDLSEAYAGLIGEKFKAYIGRQSFFYGEHRLIGTFDWSNVGNSFDGFRIIGDFGDFGVEAFTVILRNRYVTEGPVEKPTGDSVYSILGGLYSIIYNIHPYVFILYDNFSYGGGGIGFPENKTPKNAKIISPGVYSNGEYKLGNIKPFYAFEATYQFGNAWAYTMNAFAVFGRIGVNIRSIGTYIEYNLASGTDTLSLKKGIRRTPYNFFPTNHLHYGFADMFSWKNLKALRFNVQAKYSNTGIYIDFWKFSLYSKYDKWYHAGQGIYLDPKGSSSDAGYETDLTIEINPIKNLKISSGFSHFIPGEVVKKSHTDAGLKVSPMEWGFLQVVINF